MMKIVPASRLVTEASPEPPTRLLTSERRRAIGPEGEGLADSVSITATAGHPRNTPRGGGDIRGYQLFVKMRLAGGLRPAAGLTIANLAIAGSDIPGAPAHRPP